MVRRKRIKRDSDILTLSDHVFQRIIQFAGTSGLVALSSTCKRYREELEPYVFQNIKAIWHDFETEDFKDILNQKRHLITQIRIIDSYSYGEWQIDIFTETLNKLPCLQRFVINSYNSSNWCKYRKNDTIRTLEMYYDPDHKETESLYQNPNPKNINRLYKPTNLPKIFNLNHVNNFHHLTDLRLTGFHFNWTETEDLKCIQLKFLKLVDCTWQYPFEILKFNETNSLISLEVNYTKANTFTYSERFSMFLAQPLQPGNNLESLTIRYNIEIGHRLLSTELLETVINKEKFPRLTRLKLEGWETTDELLASHLARLGFSGSHPMRITLGTGRVHEI